MIKNKRKKKPCRLHDFEFIPVVDNMGKRWVCPVCYEKERSEAKQKEIEKDWIDFKKRWESF
jgi:hypothetical protein